MIDARDRAKALERARQAFWSLAADTSVSAEHLGLARDSLGLARRHADPAAVWRAVDELEEMAAKNAERQQEAP